MSSPVAAQLYTLREYCTTPADTRATLLRLQALGFSAVQLSGVCAMPPAQFKEYADEAGQSICVTHSPWARIVGDTDALIAEHKLYGCRYVGLGYLPHEYHAPGGIRQLYRDGIDACRAIADAGLLFCYHNHRFEFERHDGRNMLEWMDELFAPDHLGFILDTHWIAAGGLDPAKTVRRFANRTPLVHLKDYATVQNERRYAAVGDGVLDWAEIFADCKAAGVAYYPIEQDECYGEDAFDCLARSLAFCMSFMACTDIP